MAEKEEEEQQQLIVSAQSQQQQQLVNVEDMAGGLSIQSARALMTLFKSVDLRRQRDCFEMLADDEFMDMLTTAATYLEGLHYYRAGRNRFKVFTTPFISRAFRRAMDDIAEQLNAAGDEESVQDANEAKQFVLDTWYFNTLPEEIRMGPDPELGGVNRLTNDSSNFCVDWLSLLQDMDQKWPGFVRALYSACKQERNLLEKMQQQQMYAIKQFTYNPTNRGAPNDDSGISRGEPMSRIENPLKKVSLRGTKNLTKKRVKKNLY